MKLLSRILPALILAWFCFEIMDSSYAQDRKAPQRQKVIDFEGDLVEGVNKQPLDSLSEISEAQKRKRKMHLYRKRRGFKTEIQETLREMRYPQ